MKNLCFCIAFFLSFTLTSFAQQVQVNPTGVNVNSSNPTTAFLTYGPVRNFRPAEAMWCGAVTSAAPALGARCVPGTIYGSQLARYNLARPSGNAGFTDIMSIPTSVMRRAYQEAQSGGDSTFFYVRHFVNVAGGPDEYVAVTCRLSGGGARVPLSLTDVRVSFANESSETGITNLKPGAKLPALQAEILYTGTGRLKGRWEVVKPGDELPEAQDLLTEASLPIEERSTQRRYTQISRFNVFLPPTGKVILPGPEPKLLPTNIEGAYQILLRIEASDDREGNSDLAALGVGPDVVQSAAVAGFPLPVLRYFVGQATTPPTVALLLPADQATSFANRPLDFLWTPSSEVALYRLEVADESGQIVLTAWLPAGSNRYRLPTWARDKRAQLQWRVVTLNGSGSTSQETSWRRVRLVN
jgi:hypothetical protein